MAPVGFFNVAFVAVVAGAAVQLFRDPESRLGMCLRDIALIMVGYAIGQALFG